MDVPSTDEEKEVVMKEQKVELSKHGTSQASNSKEEDEEEEESNKEEVEEEEDELIGSSGVSVKAKGKGHTK